MLNEKTILLVDDSRALKLLTKLLLQEPYPNMQIDDVYDGVEAMEYLDIEGNIPDIILLDMNMPRMNGYEFLLEYKKRGYHNRHTKIYMLTTSTLDSDRKKVMETGLVSGYFEKPLTENNVRKIYGDIVVSR